MAFKKLDPAQYPRRLWGIYGPPGVGKSTLAARLRAPLLVIDSDGRFSEVVKLAGGDVFRLSDQAADNQDPERIAAILARDMPGSGVQTVICDSLTGILAPRVVAAIRANERGESKNRIAPFRDKALTMRSIQDALTATGADVAYIWHTQNGRNERGEEQTTMTIPKLEVARLTRSLNAMLFVFEENGRRGVRVDWARAGRSGAVVWDDPGGRWANMPAKLEAAMYDGLSLADRDRIETATPASFPNAAAAIAWGFEQGVFQDAAHAANAYEACKRQHSPKTAADMWTLWIADVTARKAAREGNGGQAQPATDPEPAY